MTTETPSATETGMRVSILQESLSRALAVVSRAAATRSSLAIAHNILLAVDGGRLKLAATDLDVAITAYAGAMIHAEGAITVPAKQFADIINGLPQCTVQLEVDPKRRRLTIEGARTSSWLSTMDAEDFPRISLGDDGFSFELEAKSLARVLGIAGVAMATDSSRPVLQTVHLNALGDTMVFVAADGFRISEVRLNAGFLVPEDGIAINLPYRAVHELERLCAKSGEPVRITLNVGRTQARFDLPEISLLTSLTQGHFPTYNELVSRNPLQTIEFDAAELRQAMDGPARMSLMGSGILRLRANADAAGVWRLTVSGRADEIGESEGQLDVAADSREPLKVAVNQRYLRDALESTDGRLRLEWWSERAQIVIRPAEADEHVLYVCMPMFVTDW